jgi:cytochrome c553
MSFSHTTVRTLCLIVAALAIMVGSRATFPAATNELHDALRLKPHTENGRKLFAANCARCHQPDGSGSPTEAVPRIAGQHFQVIVKQLADFRDSERFDPRMTAASSHLLKGPQALADVAAYLEALPEPSRVETGPDKFVHVGAVAYQRGCVHCHGTAGEGNDELRYPAVRAQHYSYLVRQLEAMAGGKRPNAAWDHSGLVSGLSHDELLGTADYMSRLKSPAE